MHLPTLPTTLTTIERLLHNITFAVLSHVAFIGALLAEAATMLSAGETITLVLTLLGAMATGIWWVATLHWRVTQHGKDLETIHNTQRRLWARYDAMRSQVADNAARVAYIEEQSGIRRSRRRKRADAIREDIHEMREDLQDDAHGNNDTV